MKKLIVLFAAALAALGLCSCGKLSPALEHFQGHWVDLNSDTALDISGKEMTVSSSGTREVYTVKADTSDECSRLLNADGSGGFGFMSELTEWQEDHLSASDLVLDAEGHSYVFVREDVKAAELQIQDWSQDLPKVISSDVITSFSLRFTNRGQYGLSDQWPDCDYRWTIVRQEDATWLCDYSETYDSCLGRSYSGEVSEDYMKALAQCIQSAGSIEHNGYYMGNSASGTDYSLHVLYDSGEELQIRAKGDAGNSCVFDLEALLSAAAPLLSSYS